jgi:hypothetical protein
MHTNVICFLTFLFISVLGGCASHPRLTVMYDRPEGLKPDDRVLWENQVIGSVGTLEAGPKGKTLVPLHIKKDFRPLLTDQSRFLIEPDPFKPGNQSVRMTQLSPKGNPLPDGAVVEGSTSFSLMMEEGSRELQGWSNLLLNAIDLLQKGIRRLSEKEWQEELERQMEGWTRELERSSEEARRYFQKEVLPQIEQAVRDLLGRLKELEKDGQSLEEKLERLKRTLDSRA